MSTTIQKALALMLLTLPCTSINAANFTPNYDENKVGEYILPKAIDNIPSEFKGDAKQFWQQQQRQTLLNLFQDHVYGKTFAFDDIKIIHISPKKHLVDTQGVWQTVDMQIGTQQVQLLLVLPDIKTPAPIILGYNFCGNHSVMHNSELALSKTWANPQVCGDKVDATALTTDHHQFTAASRGIRAYRWPAPLMLEQGFGFATLYYGDILPDNPEAFEQFIQKNKPDEKSDDYSAIGIWAAGLSTVMNYLITREDIDHNNIIVFGHSRLGKTALWAGANDPRFSMVIANNSGEGGAALAKRHYGETVASITQDFPHWFNKTYASHGADTKTLPVDQHLLLSLIAPRPIYIASAENDQWADPKGEFLSVLNAKEIYQLYTTDIFTEFDFPATETPLHSRLNYHYRQGAHDVFSYDWKQYLSVAKKYLN